jgi:hypothetical protein
MEPIKVTFTPTVDDYMRTRWPAIFSNTWLVVSTALLIVFALFAGPGIIGNALENARNGTFTWGAFMANGGIFIVTFGVMIVYGLVISPMALRWRTSQHEELVAKTTFTFAENVITSKSRYASSKAEWETFKRAIETKEYYLLIYVTNPGRYQFIPKEAFETDEQEEAFRELLSRKLGFKGN